MNAYELAKQLLHCICDGSTDLVCVEQAAHMLCQQADLIEHYKNKAEALDKRELELLAELKSLEKDLYMIQRHYDQLDTQLHPESTK
jgi:hypothetical protein